MISVFATHLGGSRFMLSAVVGTSTASAQIATPERQEYERLFKASLANPKDLDTAFKFSELASRLNEYEAAIGALERMLFFNPGLTRVRLELGVLYFKLGSYGQAKTYLASAIEPADTPAEVRVRVQGFLTEIDRRQQTSQFSGFAQLGARYQTNGNAGPNNLNVRALGFDAVLDSKFGRRPDWNFFAAGGVRHVYDFETQGGDSWETNITGYGAWQKRLKNLDLKVGEINSGPRFAVNAGALPGWTVRPYGIVGGLNLARSAYQQTSGAGFSTGFPVGSVLVESGFEFRRRVFFDSDVYQTASQQTGQLKTLFGTLIYPVLPGLRLLGRTNLVWNDAGYQFNSYKQVGFDIGFAWDVLPPLPWIARTWTVTLLGGAFNADYRQPNFLVDPDIARKDREYHINGVLDMPITDYFGVSSQISYVNNRSNLNNYRYKNFSVSVGPTVRF